MNTFRWLGRLGRILNGLGSKRANPVTTRSTAAASSRSSARLSAHHTPIKRANPSTVGIDKLPSPAAQVAVKAVPGAMTMRSIVAKTAQASNAAEVADSRARATAHMTSQPQRTLVEVRADLARLRQSSRQRRAEAERARDTSFAPTDFMGLSEHALPGPEPTPAFSPTVYLDFGAARARQGH